MMGGCIGQATLDLFSALPPIRKYLLFLPPSGWKRFFSPSRPLHSRVVKTGLLPAPAVTTTYNPRRKLPILGTCHHGGLLGSNQDAASTFKTYKREGVGQRQDGEEESDQVFVYT